MKIYVYDMKWDGAIICVAENKEEALQKMDASGEISLDFYRRNKHCYEIKEYNLDAVATTVGDW